MPSKEVAAQHRSSPPSAHPLLAHQTPHKTPSLVLRFYPKFPCSHGPVPGYKQPFPGYYPTRNLLLRSLNAWSTALKAREPSEVPGDPTPNIITRLRLLPLLYAKVSTPAFWNSTSTIGLHLRTAHVLLGYQYFTVSRVYQTDLPPFTA
jgi:hypothetical protein